MDRTEINRRHNQSLYINSQLSEMGLKGYYSYKKERGIDMEYYSHKFYDNKNKYLISEYRYYPVQRMVQVHYRFYTDYYVDERATQTKVKRVIRGFIGGERYIVDVQQQISTKKDKNIVQYSIYISDIDRLATKYECEMIRVILEDPVYSIAK